MMSPADRQSDDNQSDDNGREDPPDLVTDAQRREAFARLFAQHDRWLFSYLVVLLGGPADAEEVFQEVCVVLWREYEKFQFGTNFVKWVSVIANHQVHRFRSKSKRKLFPFDEQLLDVVGETAVGRADIFEQRREGLRMCLAKLSSEDRQVIQHCYNSETTNFKTAAELLGRPANTIYKALNRIRRMLHKCIEQKLSAEGSL